MSLILGSRVLSATGGTISSITGYRVHTFTTSGTFTPSTTGFIEVLVIGAGGGATNASYSGGGGGGSVLYSKFVPVSAGVAYTANIGAASGGASGGNTTLFYGPGPIATNYIVAWGGGYGGPGIQGIGGPGNGPPLGQGGGSGGGGGGVNTGAGAGGPGGSAANVIGYGFSGGTPNPGPGSGGGGGGGAGSIGNNGVLLSGGAGGNGLSYSINGTATVYGSGGNGTAPPAGASFPSGNYGSAGSGFALPSPSTLGTPGAIIIRYIV